MSFSGLPFAKGHVGINTRNVLKVHKKYNNTNTQYEPKAEKAHYQINQGLKEWRIGP